MFPNENIYQLLDCILISLEASICKNILKNINKKQNSQYVQRKLGYYCFYTKPVEDQKNICETFNLKCQTLTFI